MGSCGLLSEDTDSDIIVPDYAYRDEGVSWHYIPSKEEKIEVKTCQKTCEILKELKIEYKIGSTWTTDAVYRETPSAVSYYKNKGCLCVEMECASIMAVAEYIKTEAFQFFFSADSFQKEKWEEKRLFKMADNLWSHYLRIAFNIALN